MSHDRDMGKLNKKVVKKVIKDVKCCNSQLKADFDV